MGSPSMEEEKQESCQMLLTGKAREVSVSQP